MARIRASGGYVGSTSSTLGGFLTIVESQTRISIPVTAGSSSGATSSVVTQVFNSTSTWSVPTGVTSMTYVLVGGGGGGA